MAHDKHAHDAVPRQHKARAPASAKVYVITCSDSRTEATDEGGRIIKSRLADKGHALSGSAIVPDGPVRIGQEPQPAKDAGAQGVLITGGTRSPSRVSTLEAGASEV